MAKYHLKDLDCAQCASKIETELQKNKGLECATVNFATQTLVLDAAFEGTARDIIRRVEPSVEMVAEEAGVARAEERPGAWHLVRLIVSAVLFVVGLVFNRQLHDTPYAIAEYAVLLPAYFLVGWPVLKSALFDLVHGRVFNEMFLMTIATGGALLIHQIPEAVGVMLFYSIGEYFQDRAVEKSRKSIAGLMDIRPEFARVLENGGIRITAPESVNIGDLVEVRPGERIPLDGEITEGASFVDTASLTGESVPRPVGQGDSVLAGYVNDSGRLLVRVTAAFGQSSVARILDLVENAAANKAPTEKFISRFASVYTPVVVAVAAALAIFPPLFIPGATFSEYAYRALVLLVISCPCALVVSVPLGYFGGIGSASRHKLLVKGANYIDALTKVDTVVFDKTGTLTKGVFEVTDIVTRNGFPRDEILKFAAGAESLSSHPIARSIREAAGDVPTATGNIEEIRGYGVIADVGGHNVMAGNDRLMHRNGILHDCCDVGGTVIHVAVDGVYAGYILISDVVKDEAASAVRELKALGVRRVVMLTGDTAAVADEVATTLGIDECYAELLPEDKVNMLATLKKSAAPGKKVVFVGDGMNDAPVIMRSDVGFAMGGLGSDAAIEAADVVVMDDHIARVPLALRISAFTHRVVLQNVVFALGVKGVFILLGAAGEASMWEAVIADVGVSLLAVLNAIRTVKYEDRH